MGVVYKARDSRLDRFVAIKMLSSDKTADAERKRRFVQEAKAASALNHPNIVTIHEIDQADGIDFIAMEYVAGKTLDGLIPRHGMRLHEALRYATQIAGALARAHSAGIVHRDLKPGNIMVDEHGLVKVLDFGLAKLTETAPSAGDEATRTIAPVTAEGAIVGTAPYMSPEHLVGRKVDSRSDIFSFGAVLYEMITGRRAFQGGTPLSTLTAVLRQEPDPPRSLVEDLPAEIERVILRCLRKDPARRFQNMADLKVALEELREESDSGQLAASKPRPPKRRLRWLAAAAGLALVTAGIWLGRRWIPAKEQPLIPVPLTSYAGRVIEPAFSPEGKQVAFAWNGEKQDGFHIYIKLVGLGAPLRLTSGPEPDRSPAWSPDGRQIAFVRFSSNSRSAIMLVPALGGAERTIAAGMFYAGLTWSADGQSLVVASRDNPESGCGLYVLSVATGEMKRLTHAPAAAWSGDVQPAMSPDGRTLAFSRSLTRANSEIYLLPLSRALDPEGQPRRLTYENGSSGTPAWSPDGKTVVFSSGSAGSGSSATLMTIPASASGERAERAAVGEGGESPTISNDGKLVYMRWVRDENVWRLPLREGKPAPPERFLFSTRRDIEPRFSADGKRVAFTSDRTGHNEVWLCDADGSNQAQLTSFGSGMTSAGRWSPDGRRLVFLSNKEGQQEIYLISANGGAALRLTNHPGHDSAPSWSRDGRWIYFTSNREDGFQLWKMPPDPNTPPVRLTRHGGYAAIESVDGKTIYYSKRDDQSFWAVWKMPAAGGEETQVIPRIATWGDFDVTGAGIYYIDSGQAGAKLRLMRFSDGRDIVLGAVEKRVSFGLAASPDDTAVLYSQFDQESTELVLVDRFR